MKRRSRLLFNLCALGLLVFALYLNFIKKDVPEAAVPGGSLKAAPPSVTGKEASKIPLTKKDTKAVVASK